MLNKTIFFILVLSLFISIGSFAYNKYPSLVEIQKINFQIYDNSKDKLSSKVLNNYGNDMNIFLSIYLNQKKDVEGTYRIVVEGFGKGRENEAEGRVEDYKIRAEKNVVLYYEGGKYIPFVLEFPCTKDASYKVSVINNNETIIKEEVKSKFSYCYLN